MVSDKHGFFLAKQIMWFFTSEAFPVRRQDVVEIRDESFYLSKLYDDACDPKMRLDAIGAFFITGPHIDVMVDLKRVRAHTGQAAHIAETHRTQYLMSEANAKNASVGIHNTRSSSTASIEKPGLQAMERAGTQFGRHAKDDPRTTHAQRTKGNPKIFDTSLHVSPIELCSKGIELYCNSNVVITIPRQYHLAFGTHIHTVTVCCNSRWIVEGSRMFIDMRRIGCIRDSEQRRVTFPKESATSVSINNKEGHLNSIACQDVQHTAGAQSALVCPDCGIVRSTFFARCYKCRCFDIFVGKDNMMFAACMQTWRPQRAPQEVVQGMREDEENARAVRARLTAQPSTLTAANLTAHTVAAEKNTGISKVLMTMEGDARSTASKNSMMSAASTAVSASHAASGSQGLRSFASSLTRFVRDILKWGNKWEKMSYDARCKLASQGRSPIVMTRANFIPTWTPAVDHTGLLPIIDGTELSISDHGLSFAKTELITHLWNMVWGEDEYVTDDEKQTYQNAVMSGEIPEDLKQNLSRAIFTRVTKLERIEYSAAELKTLPLNEELQAGFLEMIGDKNVDRGAVVLQGAVQAAAPSDRKDPLEAYMIVLGWLKEKHRHKVIQHQEQVNREIAKTAKNYAQAAKRAGKKSSKKADSDHGPVSSSQSDMVVFNQPVLATPSNPDNEDEPAVAAKYKLPTHPTSQMPEPLPISYDEMATLWLMVPDAYDDMPEGTWEAYKYANSALMAISVMIGLGKEGKDTIYANKQLEEYIITCHAYAASLP